MKRDRITATRPDGSTARITLTAIAGVQFVRDAGETIGYLAGSRGRWSALRVGDLDTLPDLYPTRRAAVEAILDRR